MGATHLGLTGSLTGPDGPIPRVIGRRNLRQEADTWVWRGGGFNAATRPCLHRPMWGPVGWCGNSPHPFPGVGSLPPTHPRTPGFVQPSCLEACCQWCWAQSDHSQVLPRPPTFWAWLGDLACLQFTSLWIYYYFALSMPADNDSLHWGKKNQHL